MPADLESAESAHEPTPMGAASAEAHPISERLLFGVRFAALRLRDVLELCDAAVTQRRAFTIGVVNAAKLVKMREDDRLRASVLGCDIVLADGLSIVWASRLLRRGLPERVAGIDLFTGLLERAERRKQSVYLLGATGDVMERLVRRIAADHPSLRLAGSRDGYFSPDEEESIAGEIRRSGADFLFVGMSSPRKENFLARWWTELGVSVCHGVGGSFDVLAGEVRRAPVWMQRAGLEWFFRLAQEPRRLWRRYLSTNSRFAWLCIKELLRPTEVYAEARPPGRGASLRS